MPSAILWGTLGSAITLLIGIIGFWVRRWINGTDDGLSVLRRDMEQGLLRARENREEIEGDSMARDQKIQDRMQEQKERNDRLYADKQRVDRLEERMVRNLERMDGKLDRLLERNATPVNASN